jgi:hypothetical protein
MAASRQAVTYPVGYENLTPEQTLERNIQRDLAAIANPGNGGKVHETQLAQANAKKALANDQAALEAYKTAGPKMAIPYLEQAVRDDQFAISHWGNGGKLSTMVQARDSAQSKLTEDQFALNTLRAE